MARPAEVKPLPQVPRAAPPPFALPGLHFAASGCWLLAVAGMLPWLAPRIALGQVLDPPVFALVHAALLGVVGSAIFGTLYQFVPGGLEVPLRSVRLGFVGLGTWQAGSATLVAGFLTWSGPALAAAWLLLFASVGAASVNLLPARRRSPHGRLVGLHLSVAHSALGIGMAIALARIGELLGWWQVERLALLGVHLQLGLIGFGTITAVGVGSRMLPAFLMAQGDDAGRLRRILAFLGTGLAVASLAALVRRPWLATVGGILLLAGGLLVLDLGGRWFARRSRPALDAPLWHVAAAFAGLGAGAVWGILLLADGRHDVRRWAAYVAALTLGWLVMLVLGVMAKIVSHLSYIHLFSRMPGFGRIGDPNRLLRADWMWASGLLLAVGALALPITLGHGWPGAARSAATVWAAGALLAVGNYARMFIRGRWPGPEQKPGRIPRFG